MKPAANFRRALPAASGASPAAEPLRTLLCLVREGGALYQAKAAETESAEIQALCLHLAESRAALAGSLSRLPALGGQAGGAAFDFDAVARAETALQRAFEQIAAQHDSRALRQAFKQYLPQARACQEELRQLTQTVAETTPRVPKRWPAFAWRGKAG